MYACYAFVGSHIADKGLISINGGSGGSAVELISGASSTARPQGLVSVVGVLGFNSSATQSAYVYGSTVKSAVAAEANNAIVCGGGTLGLLDTSVSMPGSITTLSIGSRPAGTAALNGHLKQIMHLPRRMSNADMQTLTT
jgi:hypothetical protein